MSPVSSPSSRAEVLQLVGRAREAALAYQREILRLPPPAQLHAGFAGEGKVYHGKEFLADVDYKLKDVEEEDKDVFPMGHRERGEPSDARTGQRGVYGWLRTPGRKDSVLTPHVGTRLQLILEDGRALEFTVTKATGTDSWLVQCYDSPR